jgi:hypothetical protein
MRPRTFLVLFVTFALVFAVQCQKQFAVPEELIGVWVTKDPNYSDRPFEIKKDTVIFEQGLGYLDFDVYPIAGVKKTESEGQTLYIIYYTIPSGKKFEFSFYYSAAKGGEIRFKNQPEMLWTKKKS